MNNSNSGQPIQQSGNYGIGVMSGGNVTTENVAGVINTETSRNRDIDTVAQEIQLLLQKLETSFPMNTTSGKIGLVAEAVKQVENQPTLKQRLVAALKKGGTKAFEKAIDHPVASFFVGAVEGWTEGS